MLVATKAKGIEKVTRLFASAEQCREKRKEATIFGHIKFTEFCSVVTR